MPREKKRDAPRFDDFFISPIERVAENLQPRGNIPWNLLESLSREREREEVAGPLNEPEPSTEHRRFYYMIDATTVWN